MGIRGCDWIGADYANGASDSENSFELISKVDGEKTIFPIGTEIYIVGIDTEGIVNSATDD